MTRQTVKSKEELKKKEKVDKRKQEIEEQAILGSGVTTIKYTKGLKHQVSDGRCPIRFAFL